MRGLELAATIVGDVAFAAARHRLEHVEMPDPGHIATLARLGVHASVQPVFDALWGGADGMYTQRLGPQRALAMNPLAALAAAGVPLAFGSDSPVTPLGPWEAVRAAVHHQTPGSALPLDVALAAHTVGGWQAAGLRGGTLVVGAPASFAVWDGGPGLPSLAPGAVTPRCVRTVVEGATVWDITGTS